MVLEWYYLSLPLSAEAALPNTMGDAPGITLESVR